MNLLVYIYFLFFSTTIYIPGAILYIDNRVVNKKSQVGEGGEEGEKENEGRAGMPVTQVDET